MEFRRKMWIKVSANNTKERAHTALSFSFYRAVCGGSKERVPD